MFFRKKQTHRSGCMACHVVVSFLLYIAGLASLIGVMMAHFDPRDGALVFGTASASLSLIAFAVTITLWMHEMKHCFSGCDACATPAPVAGKKK